MSIVNEIMRVKGCLGCPFFRQPNTLDYCVCSGEYIEEPLLTKEAIAKDCPLLKGHTIVRLEK